MLTMTEFARERGISQQALSMYITRHLKEFDGHLIREDGRVYLDDTAMEKLNKKYPPASDLVVYKDTQKTLDRLAEAETEAKQYRVLYEKELNENKGLLKEIGELRMLEAKAATAEALLDFKTNELDLARSGMEKEEQARKEAEEKAAELREELVRLKNRSLWQRIRNK